MELLSHKTAATTGLVLAILFSAISCSVVAVCSDGGWRRQRGMTGWQVSGAHQFAATGQMQGLSGRKVGSSPTLNVRKHPGKGRRAPPRSRWPSAFRFSSPA